jgi:hypothetical protein
MKIGILGSGDVAKALAAGFIGCGDTVMLGSREPAKLADWQRASGERALVGSFAQTAEYGEIVLIATLGTAAEAAITQAQTDNFDGKVVIDATNPLDTSAGAPKLAWGFDDSNGERIARALPNAHVVKAFNTVGSGLFVHPELPGGPPTMFVAGNDAAAKRRVGEILERFGWESADIGGIEGSRYLEPMCLAWVLYGVTNNAWSGHAFKLLRARQPGR